MTQNSTENQIRQSTPNSLTPTFTTNNIHTHTQAERMRCQSETRDTQTDNNKIH